MAKLKTVPPTPETTLAPVKKSRKKLFIVLGLVLVLAGGGAGAWFFLQPGATPATAATAEKKPPVFVTLEPFTVNLLPENGDHYLQVGVVYQVGGDKAVDAMKTYMPVVRSRILLLLSGKHPSDLSQLEGKQKLVGELLVAARESLPEGANPERGIDGAFLSAFVIQ